MDAKPGEAEAVQCLGVDVVPAIVEHRRVETDLARAVGPDLVDAQRLVVVEPLVEEHQLEGQLCRAPPGPLGLEAYVAILVVGQRLQCVGKLRGRLLVRRGGELRCALRDVVEYERRRDVRGRDAGERECEGKCRQQRRPGSADRAGASRCRHKLQLSLSVCSGQCGECNLRAHRSADAEGAGADRRAPVDPRSHAPEVACGNGGTGRHESRELPRVLPFARLEQAIAVVGGDVALRDAHIDFASIRLHALAQFRRLPGHALEVRSACSRPRPVVAARHSDVPGASCHPSDGDERCCMSPRGVRRHAFAGARWIVKMGLRPQFRETSRPSGHERAIADGDGRTISCNRLQHSMGTSAMNRTNMNAWMPRLLIAVAPLACFGAVAQVSPAVDEGDPPMRVGRLAYYSGEVSYSPAGDEQWVAAQVNRPIVIGDRLWSDQDGRVEVSIDDGSWYLGPVTSVTVSNLDDRTTQLQLQQGTLDVTLRRLPAANVVEIDTPNIAFSLTRPGRYRIDVDPDGGSTSVIVRSGSGIVYGDESSYVVAGGQAYRFFGTDLRDNQFLAPPPYDAFDRWTAARERRYANAVSARYVSPDVVGYADLDSYGSWSVVASYGNVWFPREVAAGWAPFHYGRWVHADRGWGWVPGPVNVRPYYAPALVAFVGGSGFGVSISAGPAIGWLPLGPREVYRPPYHVSRDYFRQVNVSNTVVNNTTITNIYNNVNVTQVNYVNMRVPNAVTAVPPAAFASSQQVHRVALALTPAAIAGARVEPLARIAPARSAFVGAAPPARAKPPAVAERRPVVARMAPPPPPVPISRQLPALERNPGQPINRAEVRTLRAEAPVTAPAVRIVGGQANPAPTTSPPARRSVVPSASPVAPERRAVPSASPAAPERRGVPAPAQAPGVSHAPPVPAQAPGVSHAPPVPPATPVPESGADSQGRRVPEARRVPQVRPAPEAKPAPAREIFTPQVQQRVPERPAAPVQQLPEARRVPVPQARPAPVPQARPAPVPEARRVPVPQARPAPVPEARPE